MVTRLLVCSISMCRFNETLCCCIGSKLKEVNDQQQFNRNVEDIEVWLGEIEGQLMSEDYGKVFCPFV